MRALRLLTVITLVLLMNVTCARQPPAFTILHFNDVYEIEPVEGGRAGGLARVAAFRSSLLKTEAPVLTTLGGDYLSPSAIGSAKVDGQPLAGRQMVDVLNAVGLDWATFGNHEFDLPESAFHQRLAEQKFKLVSSNVTSENGYFFDGTVRSTVVPIHTRARDLRIGLIGLTLDANPKPWVKYLPPIEAAKAEIARLRSAGPVDAIVALTHLTLAEDQALVSEVGDIDLVLGGHEHDNWMLRRGSRFVPIVKADSNVRSVFVVRLTFDRGDGRPTIAARLQAIDDRITPDPKVQAIADGWRAKAFEALKQQGFDPATVVATISEPLDGRESTVRNMPGRLTDLIADSMLREAGQADLALFNSGLIRIDDVLRPGPLTQYDVMRVLPLGGAVVKATFDGVLLAQVLDAGMKNQGGGGSLQTAGVTRAGGRWLIGGKPLVPAHRYQVALNDFLLSGSEANLGFLVRTNPHVHDIHELRDVRQALIAELRAKYGK
jgi:5'-nucleotidase